MIIVAPCPFEDDFAIAPDCARELERHTIRIVPHPDVAGDRLRDAEVLVTGFENQTTDPLRYVQAMPALRWIHALTAGLGSLIDASVADRDVLVTNGAGTFAPAIAEYVLAALVVLVRDLKPVLRDGIDGRWCEHRLGRELAARKAGIIGFGGIGRRVSTLLTGVGMEVSAVTRSPERHRGESDVRLMGMAALPQLLAESDVVVLCASQNPSTIGLLGAAEFSSMKQGAVFVNVARGALVDELALTGALADGPLAAALIDVAAVEPLPADSPLWRVDNLLITPHMAGGTVEGRARSLARFTDNLHCLDRGAPDQMVSRVDIRRELSSPDA